MALRLPQLRTETRARRAALPVRKNAGHRRLDASVNWSAVCQRSSRRDHRGSGEAVEQDHTHDGGMAPVGRHRTCQISPDAVVKTQAMESVEIILYLSRRPALVQPSCRHRTSRHALLAPSEIPWSTTPSAGMCQSLVEALGRERGRLWPSMTAVVVESLYCHCCSAASRRAQSGFRWVMPEEDSAYTGRGADDGVDVAGAGDNAGVCPPRRTRRDFPSSECHDYDGNNYSPRDGTQRLASSLSAVQHPDAGVSLPRRGVSRALRPRQPRIDASGIRSQRATRSAA